VPQHLARARRPPPRSGRKRLCRSCRWTRHPRTFPPRGSVVVCFARRYDSAHQTRRLGGPALRALWIPAHTPHSVAMTGLVSLRTLYLQPGLARNFRQKCLVVNVSPLLKELILHACKFPKLKRERLAQRRVIEILLDQLKVAESVPLQLPHPSDSRAVRVVNHLSENPADSQSLEKLCRQCGASKRTIQRLFLEETKMTFARWRQQLRLLHALRLLASGEKVTVAALESGYDSASAFISMFRKQLGSTPKRYLAAGFGRRHPAHG